MQLVVISAKNFIGDNIDTLTDTPPITRPTPEEIRAMLKKHRVTREQAARLAQASLKTWHGWSAPVGSVNHRPIHLAAWELLLIKLGEHPLYGPL